MRHPAVRAFVPATDSAGIPGLVNRLTDEYQLIREEAAEALAAHGWVPQTTGDRLAFFAAQRRFSEIEPGDLVTPGPLIEILDDHYSSVRSDVAHVFGRGTDDDEAGQRIISVLLRCVTDHDMDVRLECVRSLETLGGISGEAALHPDILAAKRDWGSLLALGEDARPTLLWIAEQDSILGPWALEWLNGLTADTAEVEGPGN